MSRESGHWVKAGRASGADLLMPDSTTVKLELKLLSTRKAGRYLMPAKSRIRPRLSAKNGPSRIYKVGHMWYFSTRERTEEGPFSTTAEAESCLDDYVMMMCLGLIPPDGSDLIERYAIQSQIE